MEAVQTRVSIGEGFYLNSVPDYNYSKAEKGLLVSLRKEAEGLLVEYGSPDYLNHYSPPDYFAEDFTRGSTLKGLAEVLPGIIKKRIALEPNWRNKLDLLRSLIFDYPLWLKPQHLKGAKMAESSARRLLMLAHDGELLIMRSQPRADQDWRSADLLFAAGSRSDEVDRICQRRGLQEPEFPPSLDDPDSWAKYIEAVGQFSKLLASDGWRGQIAGWPILLESSRFETDLPENRGSIRVFMCVEPEETIALSHILIIKSPETPTSILEPNIDPRKQLVIVTTSHGNIFGQKADLGFIPWTDRSISIASNIVGVFRMNGDLAQRATEFILTYHPPV